MDSHGAFMDSYGAFIVLPWIPIVISLWCTGVRFHGAFMDYHGASMESQMRP